MIRWLLPLCSSLLLLITLPLLVSAADDSKICYNRDGNFGPDGNNWKPCDPGADSSPCCGAKDYCMDNGLCLNADGNQFLTVQGCTSAKWDKCADICKDQRGKAGEPYEGDGVLLTFCPQGPEGYAKVWMCDMQVNAGMVKYCCGDYGCCNQTKNVGSIRIAKAVYRPPQAASASVSTSSTSASASASASSNGADQHAHDSNNDSRNLAIGLGVGIPMGLALLGGIIFLGLQVRKWTAVRQAQGATGNHGGGGVDNAQEVKRYDEPPSFFQRQELHDDQRGAELN
ncbi:hypothetical protein PG997_008628 [Apiospora hydei]|uniref:Mid2 domain-containing protein n=1 Tax=Apiospora hydei TaxID=1337664 RepID=A0ABR1WEC1_9PEZI